MQLFNSAFVTTFANLICSGEKMRQTKVTVRYGVIKCFDGKICLVDTGYGPSVTTGPRSIALRIYNKLLGPTLVEAGSPQSVLSSMGFKPSDVDLVILTHFHADHVARINEFPNASIIAHSGSAKSIFEMGKLTALHNGIFKELLPPNLETRIEPLESLPLVPAHENLGLGYDIFGDGSYLAIGLPGHAEGHFGIYWQSGDDHILYATDVTWTMKSLVEDKSPAFARGIVFHDVDAGNKTEEKLRKFIASGGTVKLCHDWEAEI